MGTTIERRRFRRAELDVPVSIRSRDGEGATATVIGQLKDVSLAGLYCYTKTPCPLQLGDRVICSVQVPPEEASEFPFSRVLSKGWVVRVEPREAARRAGDEPAEEPRCGVAVAFAPDVTALGSISR